MTTTPFLNLVVTGSTTGSATSFLQSVTDQFGLTNSNMTKIDTFATGTSASLTSLKVGQIVSVPATFVSSGSYTASAGLLTSYQTNQLINLKLNANNPGATTLNINSLGYKYLKKINSAGTIVDLGANDLISGAYNLFTYDNTQWVWTAISGSATSSGSGGTTYVGTAPITVTGSIISHNVSGVSSGSYNMVIVDINGHVTAGSYTIVTSGCSYSANAPISITGSVISHNTSGVTAGSYLAANIIIDVDGHITSASSGVSASSVGAPSDSPFVTTASNVNLTNYRILTAGSNVTITPAGFNGGPLYINATSSGGLGADGWSSTDAMTYLATDSPTFTVTVAGDQTAKYFPGMRIKLTDSTIKYFIITSVTYTSSTAITLYGGTDYSLTGGAISSPYYSGFKAPAGFPLDPAKWTIELLDTTLRSQVSPTAKQWYNVGSLSLTIPIGIWNVGYYVSLQVGADIPLGYVGLSTDNNTQGDSKFTSYGAASPPSPYSSSFWFTKFGFLTLVAKTIYYLNGMSQLGGDIMYYRNDISPAIIRATCTYL